jgi:hypothetical protein
LAADVSQKVTEPRVREPQQQPLAPRASLSPGRQAEEPAGRAVVELFARLHAFYTQHDPERLADDALGMLAAAYVGNEAPLNERLLQRYGADLTGSKRAVDELSARLRKFYERYAPERLADTSMSVRNIAEAYVGGGETALNERLAESYGADLNSCLSPSSREARITAPSATQVRTASSTGTDGHSTMPPPADRDGPPRWSVRAQGHEGSASTDRARSHPEPPPQAATESSTELGKHAAVDELFSKLCIFYKRYAPERLTDSSLSVRNIAETYAGREEALNERLAKTYGADLNGELVRDRPAPVNQATTVETLAAEAEAAASAALAAAEPLPPARKLPTVPPRRASTLTTEDETLAAEAETAASAALAAAEPLPPARKLPTVPPRQASTLTTEDEALAAAALAASNAVDALASAPRSCELPAAVVREDTQGPDSHSAHGDGGSRHGDASHDGEYHSESGQLHPSHMRGHRGTWFGTYSPTAVAKGSGSPQDEADVPTRSPPSAQHAATAEEGTGGGASGGVRSERSAMRGGDGSDDGAEQQAARTGGADSEHHAEVAAEGKRPGAAALDVSSDEGDSPAVYTSEEYAALVLAPLGAPLPLHRTHARAHAPQRAF